MFEEPTTPDEPTDGGDELSEYEKSFLAKKAPASPDLSDYERSFLSAPKEAASVKPVGWWTQDKIDQSIKHLQKTAKLSHLGATALVARWAGVEATGGPDSVNPDSGAIGIGQWLGSRKKGVPKDHIGQLDYAAKELNGPEAFAAKLLRDAKTPEEAAIGAAAYERAEGYDPKNPLKGDRWVKRTLETMGKIPPMKPHAPEPNPVQDLTDYEKSFLGPKQPEQTDSRDKPLMVPPGTPAAPPHEEDLTNPVYGMTPEQFKAWEADTTTSDYQNFADTNKLDPTKQETVDLFNTLSQAHAAMKEEDSDAAFLAKHKGLAMYLKAHKLSLSKESVAKYNRQITLANTARQKARPSAGTGIHMKNGLVDLARFAPKGGIRTSGPIKGSGSLVRYKGDFGKQVIPERADKFTLPTMTATGREAIRTQFTNNATPEGEMSLRKYQEGYRVSKLEGDDDFNASLAGNVAAGTLTAEQADSLVKNKRELYEAAKESVRKEHQGSWLTNLSRALDYGDSLEDVAPTWEPPEAEVQARLAEMTTPEALAKSRDIEQRKDELLQSFDRWGGVEKSSAAFVKPLVTFGAGVARAASNLPLVGSWFNQKYEGLSTEAGALNAALEHANKDSGIAPLLVNKASGVAGDLTLLAGLSKVPGIKTSMPTVFALQSGLSAAGGGAKPWDVAKAFGSGYTIGHVFNLGSAVETMTMKSMAGETLTSPAQKAFWAAVPAQEQAAMIRIMKSGATEAERRTLLLQQVASKFYGGTVLVAGTAATQGLFNEPFSVDQIATNLLFHFGGQAYHAAKGGAKAVAGRVTRVWKDGKPNDYFLNDKNQVEKIVEPVDQGLVETETVADPKNPVYSEPAKVDGGASVEEAIKTQDEVSKQTAPKVETKDVPPAETVAPETEVTSRIRTLSEPETLNHGTSAENAASIRSTGSFDPNQGKRQYSYSELAPDGTYLAPAGSWWFTDTAGRNVQYDTQIPVTLKPGTRVFTVDSEAAFAELANLAGYKDPLEFSKHWGVDDFSFADQNARAKGISDKLRQAGVDAVELVHPENVITDNTEQILGKPYEQFSHDELMNRLGPGKSDGWKREGIAGPQTVVLNHDTIEVSEQRSGERRYAATEDYVGNERRNAQRREKERILANTTPQTVHNLATDKGLEPDSPAFKEATQKLVGKDKLDGMDKAELTVVKNAIDTGELKPAEPVSTEQPVAEPFAESAKALEPTGVDKNGQPKSVVHVKGEDGDYPVHRVTINGEDRFIQRMYTQDLGTNWHEVVQTESGSWYPKSWNDPSATQTEHQLANNLAPTKAEAIRHLQTEKAAEPITEPTQIAPEDIVTPSTQPEDVSTKGENVDTTSSAEFEVGDPVFLKDGTEVTVSKIDGDKVTVDNPHTGEQMVVKASTLRTEPYGPGTANVGDVPVESDISQLTEVIKGLDLTDRTRGLTGSLHAADVISAGKDFVTRARARMQAVWDWYAHRPPVTDYMKAVGDFLYADQKAAYEVRQFVDSIKQQVKNPLTQEAVTNFIQAGGDRALLQQRADMSTGKLKAGYERAANLTPEEEVLATNIGSYFESRLAEGQRLGLINHAVENYVNQIWERGGKPSGNFLYEMQRGALDPKFRFGKGRVFDDFFEGEQAGYTPLTKNIGELIPIYEAAFQRAKFSRQFVSDLQELTASDGKPMMAISGNGSVIESESPSGQTGLVNPKAKGAAADGYLAVDHPAMRGWKWVTSIEDTPVLMKGDLLVHPEAYQHLKNLLGKSFFNRYAILRTAKKISSTIKQTMLSLSLFHQVQEGVHALGHKVNPFVLSSENLKLDFDEPVTKLLVKRGLQLASFDGMEQYSEGVASGNLINKVPVIGKYAQKYQDWLFKEYIPFLKNTMAKDAYERNTKRYSKELTADQIAELTAQQANAAFGELNYAYMGRNPSYQDALRLTLLAPDFLEARGRFVGQALKPYGKEQMSALALLAITQYTVARMLNKALDDDYHWKVEDAFRVYYGGHWYGLRTIPGDVIHLVSDPRSFSYHRLNPLAVTGITAITGRNDRGEKVSYLEQAKDTALKPLPMVFRQRHDDEWWEAFVNSIGVQEGKAHTEADQVIKEYYAEKFPNGFPKATDPEKAKVKKQLVSDLRDKKPGAEQAVTDAFQNGNLTEEDFGDITKAGELTAFQAKFARLPLDTALKAYEVGTPVERGSTRDVVQKKINASDLTPELKERITNLGFELPTNKKELIDDLRGNKDMTRIMQLAESGKITKDDIKEIVKRAAMPKVQDEIIHGQGDAIVNAFERAYPASTEAEQAILKALLLDKYSKANSAENKNKYKEALKKVGVTLP